ncbi:M48 family metalloprotease [Ideonella azotifigens]|nr:M48 family metalloprotease [Ideonella azotifigens]MCD2342705.1 M48 family metalloprotease [Ideonella azotifigens]
MRWWIVTLTLLLAGPATRADEGILGVLASSQLTRLDRVTPADPASPRARTVRASFETLARVLALRHPVELRMIEGDTIAETLQGRIIVANESLGDLSEGERMFVLAHELGHIELRHWEQTERLYQKWVPGAVTPDQTEPVAALLGRDASGLAHRQELEADAFALHALHALGRTSQDAMTAFMHLGMTQDTATHPGTRKRLASLRAADAQWSRDAQATTRNELIDSVNLPD